MVISIPRNWWRPTWTFPPFGGCREEGRIYGRGITDMKAGLAAEIMAARILGRFADVCAANWS